MRVATFNILHGRSPSDGQVDVARFAGAIAALDADILALQEVDRDQPRSQGADLTAVAAEAMGAVGHRFAAALAGTPGTPWVAATGDEQPGTAGYGVALLSRYPVERWRVVRLPALRGRVPYVWHGRRTPSLVRDEARVGLVGDVATPAGTVAVACTHLSFLPGWNLVQLRRLMAALGGTPRGVSRIAPASDGTAAPLIVTGDLNLDARAVARTTRLRALATAPTFPARHPVRQIDHILGRGIAAEARSHAVELPLSDHRALVADLTW